MNINRYYTDTKNTYAHIRKLKVYNPTEINKDYDPYLFKVGQIIKSHFGKSDRKTYKIIKRSRWKYKKGNRWINTYDLRRMDGTFLSVTEFCIFLISYDHSAIFIQRKLQGKGYLFNDEEE